MTDITSETTRAMDRDRERKASSLRRLVKIKEWARSPLVVLVGRINPPGVLPDTFVSLCCRQRPAAANQRLRYCTHAASAQTVCAGQCVSRLAVLELPAEQEHHTVQQYRLNTHLSNHSHTDCLKGQHVTFHFDTMIF